VCVRAVWQYNNEGCHSFADTAAGLAINDPGSPEEERNLNSAQRQV
jgi:hypothetical protein